MLTLFKRLVSNHDPPWVMKRRFQGSNDNVRLQVSQRILTPMFMQELLAGSNGWRLQGQLHLLR